MCVSIKIIFLLPFDLSKPGHYIEHEANHSHSSPSSRLLFHSLSIHINDLSNNSLPTTHASNSTIFLNSSHSSLARSGNNFTIDSSSLFSISAQIHTTSTLQHICNVTNTSRTGNNNHHACNRGNHAPTGFLRYLPFHQWKGLPKVHICFDCASNLILTICLGINRSIPHKNISTVRRRDVSSWADSNLPCTALISSNILHSVVSFFCYLVLSFWLWTAVADWKYRNKLSYFESLEQGQCHHKWCCCVWRRAFWTCSLCAYCHTHASSSHARR